MRKLSRRRFVQTSGIVATAASRGACGGGTGAPATSRTSLTWWDPEKSLEQAKEKHFARFAKSSGGLPVEYTNVSAAKFPQVMQLAKQSDQLPDIHANVGLEAPVRQLIKDGWVAPLELSDATMARLKDSLYEGIHMVDGKVYSWPIYDYHQYMTANWFNTEMVAKAGLDPDAPPATYDAFRAAASAVQKSSGGEAHGFVWCIGMPLRLGFEVDKLAQAGGFEGGAGLLYRTGEYAYHAAPYVNAIEFLVSLRRDGLIAPGSNSWADDVARARWAVGAAGYYFSGPWTAGETLLLMPRWSRLLGVGSDRSEAERDRAIAAARNKGAEVDHDDWAFPNWKPHADYTRAMYG
ncbi:carbohydrate ABC transporter substrate-binding protein [Nonomuraea sp. K274]|uniref:Carbohydrate ABC transporter substrate-binding protein n=1 Tax=Nonomuraea cypriaca TaxID=1187855 RepID=A0A931A2X6_9ACTN|nr:ABC transporter substrate-binding protein [Nonomuraea cypriaca]MBF8185262.1 carbohydrate ABC transporter substrate-binding protein [Nonomuraea cypriaca]